MRKTSARNFGKHLLSDAAKVIENADRTVHAVMEYEHLSRWHPVSTAPYNQDLEIRVNEDGVTSALPFPCRHTNGDEWINVDLGVPLQVHPVEWRIWQTLINRPFFPQRIRQRVFGSNGAVIMRTGGSPRIFEKATTNPSLEAGISWLQSTQSKLSQQAIPEFVHFANAKQPRQAPVSGDPERTKECGPGQDRCDLYSRQPLHDVGADHRPQDCGYGCRQRQADRGAKHLRRAFERNASGRRLAFKATALQVAEQQDVKRDGD